jgi:pantothenate kinase, type III
MILTLDIGNTTLHGGVFDGDELILQFRRTTDARASSDELGVFLRSVLRENGADPATITRIAVCSVVPDAIHSVRGACTKYFGLSPFLLQPGVRTGLQIAVGNPLEVGADRIANAIGGTDLFPKKNLIIIDFGTATTFDVILGRDRKYLGGVIVAGLRISMEALESRTAKLPAVEIGMPKNVLGRSSIESVQSGLYFGQIGTIKEITHRLIDECFGDGAAPGKTIVIGTGGFSNLFENAGLFDAIHPELALRGLKISLTLNS